MKLRLGEEKLTEKSSLQTAIKMATQSWTQLHESGDPNTVDVYWHIGKVVELLGLRLPTELPLKETGAVLVECVENNFIKGSLIRQCSPQSLAERGLTLVEVIQNQRLLSIGVQETYVVALYTWHGCINMAKLLRKTYIIPDGEELYIIEMRLQGYNQLQVYLRNEDARGNPWVRYGISLAKLLEKKRGNSVVENWVPRDSPYWDC